MANTKNDEIKQENTFPLREDNETSQGLEKLNEADQNTLTGDKPQIEKYDRFSEVLLGIHSEEFAKSTTKLEPSSGDVFFDSMRSDNVLGNIAETSHIKTQILLPKEEIPLLLPQHAEPNGKKSSLLSLIFITVIAFSYLIGYESYHVNDYWQPKTQKTFGGDIKDSFLNLPIEAKAVYIYDIHSKKVLYAHNENTVLPLASLTKLMTAIVADELLPSGTTITIRKNDIEKQGDSGLLMGERFKLSDIIGFMLMTSSNDGASALAATAGSLGQNAYEESDLETKKKFIAIMNRKAEELGLLGTHFFNESGLDVNGVISGGYGTARDVATLMTQAIDIPYKNIEPTTLSQAMVVSLDNVRHHIVNTNEKINAIPGILASKTGFTDLAGGNLAIVFEAGPARPIVVVVLGSTREGRFKDTETLVWATLQNINR